MSHRLATIRIAITGGGLAGASLLHSLLLYQQLDVHIFEAASAFRQDGLAIGIGRNALSALDLMGPQIVQCLERAGAVPQRGRRTVLAQGPDAGKLVQEVTAGTQRFISVVQRAAFLRELLADVPDERMHPAKKLERVTQVEEHLVLHFVDGTVHECDILVGADGIHSRVRRAILGERDPAASPVFAGWWRIHSMRPLGEVQAALGSELLDVDDPREWGWLGDGVFVMHNILSGGDQAQVVVVGHSDQNDGANPSWQMQIATENLREMFSTWPSQISRAVDTIFGQEQSHKALCFWEHLPAKTYVKKNICMIGDAAHAMTPWQASGAAMSIEDSFILSTLLGRADSISEARAALQAYDLSRRPRTQRVVESSKGTGLIMTCRDQDTGFDAHKIQEKLRHRWDFIRNIDMSEHRDQAIGVMDALIRER